MASRKEQKEKARAERIAREQAERQESSRRRRLQIGAAVGGLAIVAAVIVVIVLANGGGGGGGGETTSSSGITYSKDSVPADVEAGLQDTPPPWKPDYNDLAGRIEAMGLPDVGNESFHQHSWLHVYVDGKPVAVPANIGIDQATQTISPLHTHPVAPDNPEGIIHMEAAEPHDFTLGQFMAIWGVKFSDNQLGSLTSSGADKQLQVYLNGQAVKDPVNVVLPEHGNVVIGFGKPGSFPTEPKLDWPQGL